jgi:hypothetical protein
MGASEKSLPSVGAATSNNPSTAGAAAAGAGESAASAPGNAQQLATQVATEISKMKANLKTAEAQEKEGKAALKSGNEASAKEHFKMAEDQLSVGANTATTSSMTGGAMGPSNSMGSTGSMGSSVTAPITGSTGATGSAGASAEKGAATENSATNPSTGSSSKPPQY